MNIEQQLREDMKTAMRGGEKLRLCGMNSTIPQRSQCLFVIGKQECVANVEENHLDGHTLKLIV